MFQVGQTVRFFFTAPIADFTAPWMFDIIKSAGFRTFGLRIVAAVCVRIAVLISCGISIFIRHILPRVPTPWVSFVAHASCEYNRHDANFDFGPVIVLKLF